MKLLQGYKTQFEKNPCAFLEERRDKNVAISRENTTIGTKVPIVKTKSCPHRIKKIRGGK